uniref:Sensory rhodopsin transducer n=1 Tax=Dictyoglomus thermophilum TaxID=14 RepID=A0A7C3MMP4_DICTH
MERELGAKIWLIPDAYLPGVGDVNLPSHESTCILNVNDKPATVKFTFYFEDRDPIESKEIVVPAKRTWHVRLDRSEEILGVKLERDVPFAIKVESNVKIVVQHSRLDTRQPNLAYMTAIPWNID